MKLIVLWLLVAASGVVSAQSQPPTPGKRNADRQAQEDSKRETQSAQPSQNQTPVVVNVTVAQPETKEPSTPEGADYYGTVADWWMVGLTLLTLGATVALVVIAVRQFIKQTKQTTKALALARQANRTATVALNATLAMTKEIERAYVDVSLVHVPEGVKNLKPEATPSVMLKIQNEGRTPAELVATVVGLVGGPGPLPQIPAYQSSVVKPDQGAGYMMPGACIYIVKDLSPMSAEIISAIEQGDLTLWLMGYVRYRDRFDRVFQRGFIRRYVPNREPERWIMDGSPGYDYDRLVSDAEQAVSQPHNQ
jgi:hypothetical protein